MRSKIYHSIANSISAVNQLNSTLAIEFIENVSASLADCFQNGGKVIIAGNGGSLCDASHFAEELTGLFRHIRPALPAIALSDPSHITCVANDLGFEWIFARGVEAYGKSEDIFVGLTTSGNSPNIIRAVEAAEKKEMTTVLFLGKNGGKLKGRADYELMINEFPTSDRIQEAHMTAIHIIIEMVEELMFSDQALSLSKELESEIKTS